MDDRVLHDFLVESIPLWQQNPVQFFEEVLFFYPDEWQKEAAFALRDNPKVTIKSGQGVGKTGMTDVFLFGKFLSTSFPYPVSVN